MTREELKAKIEVEKIKFLNWKAAKKTEVKIFWENNKDVIAPLIIPGIVGAAGLAKAASKAYKTRQEEDHWNRDFYDPRTGTHFTTKKTPSQRQRAEIDRRYLAGESKAEILMDMKLI